MCTGLPSNLSVGQPTWTRDGSGLVVVAWPAQAASTAAYARKLGVVFCYNRRCTHLLFVCLRCFALRMGPL